VLLAVEGVTILRIHALLNVHVFIGVLLVPPVLVKMGSTGWRFARHYRGDPAYRRKGPPPPILRVLGPFTVVLTVVVLASGSALVLGPHSSRSTLNGLHKVSFILWFAVMTIHVLGHIFDTARLAPLDWTSRAARRVAGGRARRWVLAASMAAGAVLGFLMVGQVKGFPHHGG
jgi:hypothetical protein